MKLFFMAVILICASAPVFAQTDDNPFLLKRGDNEWGFWAGFSPKATTIFEGLHEDEAEDRKFFIAALRYGRTLAVCSARNVPDLGEVMVREGYAVNYAIDYGGYPAAEREAQSARSGVWQGDFERPKDWRKRHPRTG